MSIHELILSKLSRDGAIHMSLIDPMSTNIDNLKQILNDIKEAASDFIMVGGSTLVDQVMLSQFVIIIKQNCDLPVILFPNNISSITKEADAIWFMSLLNSTNPYYIIQVQTLAAPYIKKFGPEPLPLAYIIVGEGRAAAFIGDAKPIPYDKPEIAAAYAAAAEIFGFKYIYLEAGSGAKEPIPPYFVKRVKKMLDKAILVVGGGIRQGKVAYDLVKAGADIIVTGNIIEEGGNLKEIVKSVKTAGGEKSSGI